MNGKVIDLSTAIELAHEEYENPTEEMIPVLKTAIRWLKRAEYGMPIYKAQEKFLPSDCKNGVCIH